MIQDSQNRDLIESQALTISYTEILTISSPCLVTFFRIPIALFEIYNFLNLLISLVFHVHCWTLSSFMSTISMAGGRLRAVADFSSSLLKCKL